MVKYGALSFNSSKFSQNLLSATAPRYLSIADLTGKMEITARTINDILGEILNDGLNKGVNRIIYTQKPA